MKDKFFSNLQLNLIITLGTGVLNFISNSYFAKYMGVDTLGLMKLFTQMVAYLSLVDLGISSASSYALYKPLAEKKIEKINSVVSTIDYFYKKIAIFILGLGGTLTIFIPFFIETNSYGYYIYIYWLMYVFNTAVGYFFARYSILFIANQEYGYVRKVQGAGRILFQIIQILFLIKIQSFLLFIVILIVENLFVYYFYRRHYIKYYNYITKVDNIEKNIVKDMKNLFWHKLGTLVVCNTDYIILVKFTSLSVIGIYSSYLLIFQIIMTIMNILTSVLTPKIGIFIVENNKKEIYNFWKKLYSIYIFIATIFTICTYNLVSPFVKLWLGDSFLLPKLTVILILVNLFISLIRGITEIFKNNCGFFDDVYTPLLESVLNLFFSLILVSKMGLNGVIIGTIVSNIFIVVLLKPILVFRRCFEKKAFCYIKDTSLLFLLSIISILITNNILNTKLKINMINVYGWMDFIYKGFYISLISLMIALPLFLLDRSFRNLILKIWNRKFIIE